MNRGSCNTSNTLWRSGALNARAGLGRGLASAWQRSRRHARYTVARGTRVVNLAPADLRKEGSALDLPISLGLLGASEQMTGHRLTEYAVVGELVLNGSVRPVAGALPMAIATRDQGLRGIVVPRENAVEAGVVPGVEVIPVETLEQAAAFMAGDQDIETFVTDMDRMFREARSHAPDLSDVKGQAHVKRALTIAAAGNHNLLTAYPV